jgi:hypothetical protein
MQNKGGTTMSKDKVISLENTVENKDILTDLLSSGAVVAICVENRSLD